MSRRWEPGLTEADLRRVEAGELVSKTLADRYRVERLIDKGGMSRVFAGVDLVTNAAVAIKVLAGEHAARASGITRFILETKRSTQLRHPNIVSTLDCGSTPEGVMFLVMERLIGRDLQQVLSADGRLTWPRVRALLQQILSGLAAAHAEGFVHRDLKPANIFCVQAQDGEQIKLIDFGVASSVADDVPRGVIIGTPEYMSPEQIRGERVDARSDIYAVGVLLCEMLTGKAPFTGKTHAQVFCRHIFTPPPTLESLAPDLKIDPRIQAVYERALAKDRSDRFASVTELSAAIAAIPAELAGEGRGDDHRRVGVAERLGLWLSGRSSDGGAGR